MLVCSVLLDGVKNELVQFDVEKFMGEVMLPDIAADSECPMTTSQSRSLQVYVHAHIASSLLSGRCLWLAGKMASFLSPPTLLK